MEITKFQLGGGFDSLFTIYRPTETPRRSYSRQTSSSTSLEELSDKGELTEKDLLLMLKDMDGLPNEMLSLVGKLTRTLRVAKLTGQDDLNSLAITYLSSLYKLKEAKYNSELFKETYDRAVENDSLNDIAITLDGHVLALDENLNIIPLTSEEWTRSKGSDKYQALTNSNLLWYRSQHPGYINNNKVLLIVENGVGLELVHKMIKERFLYLGKNESSSTTFVPKEATKGLQIIEQMLLYGPEGYYKITTDLTQTDLKQVKAALSYIYNTLPANAKTRLKLETTDGSAELAKGIIGDMIFGTISSKVKYSADFIGSLEKVSGTSKDSSENSSIDGFDKTTPAMFLAGLGHKLTFVINPGTTSAYIVNGNTLPLTNNEDKTIGSQMTLLDASKGNYHGILDFNSITMGGQLVDPLAFGHIVLPDGNITSIDFPCIDRDGVIMPKITPEIIASKKKADSEIRQRGIDLNNLESIKNNYQIINQIYQSNNLDPAYDSDGKPIQGSWARFGVINAEASNKALKLDPTSNNQLLQENNDDFSKLRYIEITKLEQWDDNNFPGWLEGDADVLYKGTLWIPINRSYVSAYIGKGINMSEAIELDKQTLALDIANSLTLGRLLQ